MAIIAGCLRLENRANTGDYAKGTKLSDWELEDPQNTDQDIKDKYGL
jgi:hypothetical protein